MSSTLERRNGPNGWDEKSIGFRGGVGAAGCRSDSGGRPPVFFLKRGPLSATPGFPKSQKRIAPKKERDAAGGKSKSAREHSAVVVVVGEGIAAGFEWITVDRTP